MRWYLEDVEKAIRGATLKIAPVVDGIVNDLNLPKNTDVFAVGGFVRDAVLGKLVGKETESKDIDLIFITHSHGDHSLLCPKLYKEGCEGAGYDSCLCR